MSDQDLKKVCRKILIHRTAYANVLKPVVNAYADSILLNRFRIYQD